MTLHFGNVELGTRNLARPIRQHWLSIALYVIVALIWLVPDRRIERVIEPSAASE